MLRELASQVNLPPLYFPMERLSAEDWQRYDATIAKSGSVLSDALQTGFLSNNEKVWANSNLNKKPNTVRDYYNYYSSCEGNYCTPTAVMQRTIKAAKELEEKHKVVIFSCIDEENVLKAAAESEQRFKENKPLRLDSFSFYLFIF